MFFSSRGARSRAGPGCKRLGVRTPTSPLRAARGSLRASRGGAGARGWVFRNSPFAPFEATLHQARRLSNTMRPLVLIRAAPRRSHKAQPGAERAEPGPHGRGGCARAQVRQPEGGPGPRATGPPRPHRFLNQWRSIYWGQINSRVWNVSRARRPGAPRVLWSGGGRGEHPNPGWAPPPRRAQLPPPGSGCPALRSRDPRSRGHPQALPRPGPGGPQAWHPATPGLAASCPGPSPLPGRAVRRQLLPYF